MVVHYRSRYLFYKVLAILFCSTIQNETHSLIAAYRCFSPQANGMSAASGWLRWNEWSRRGRTWGWVSAKHDSHFWLFFFFLIFWKFFSHLIATLLVPPYTHTNTRMTSLGCCCRILPQCFPLWSWLVSIERVSNDSWRITVDFCWFLFCSLELRRKSNF